MYFIEKIKCVELICEDLVGLQRYCQGIFRVCYYFYNWGVSSSLCNYFAVLDYIKEVLGITGESKGRPQDYKRVRKVKEC
jgi:hypothetical protein